MKKSKIEIEKFNDRFENLMTQKIFYKIDPNEGDNYQPAIPTMDKIEIKRLGGVVPKWM